MDLFALLSHDLSPARLKGLAPDYVWAALASAAATLGLMVAFGPRRSGEARASDSALAEASCDFLLQGGVVQPLTEPARALLAGLGPTPSRLLALGRHVERDCPGAEKDIEALVLYGTGFRRHCRRGDGSAFELLGEPRGAAAFFSIRAATAEARALKDAENALRRATEEARFLRDALDRAPLLAWSVGPDGALNWTNAVYRERFAPPQGELPDHRIPDAFGHVLESVPLTARDGEARRRVAVPGAQDAEPHWFEIRESQTPGGETLGFALEADDIVAAEASLRRFIETLTETFAHLPIGLAVFDKNRRLGLFNPALTDLVKIDAVWLAGRPSLRDFLERLRETRQMPEQKDFAAWRRKLGEIEEGARDGAYEENWVLPSGKIFRVTGRPHPQGALAFLFEDISTAIQLERKYRSELELSQATLDRMSEAVAVFDTSGQLVFVNSALEALWGIDPMGGLDGPGVADLTALWSERCRPTPVWARLREFATAAESRASWTDAVETRDGRTLQVLVAPLPDASALVVFRDLGEERALQSAMLGDAEARRTAESRDALLDELALVQLELPVEAAIARLTAAIPSAASPEAFQTLGAAAQALREGLARARELRALARAEPSGAGPRGMLEARGLAPALTGEAAADTPKRRRALWALALAAADAAAPGAEVSIALSPEPGALTLEARFRAGPAPRVEPVAIGLARRLIEGLGGAFACTRDEADGRMALSARLPDAITAAPVAPGDLARSA